MRYNYTFSFAAFGEWPAGIPGSQFNVAQIGQQRPHPWQHLFTLMERSKLLVVPILKMCWRVHLLHPLFVYGRLVASLHAFLQTYQYRNDMHCTVADCTPHNDRLDFRIIDGYLTGDMQMNIPPLKTVLLDPYDG